MGTKFIKRSSPIRCSVRYISTNRFASSREHWQRVFLGFWNWRNKEETAKNTVVLQSRTNGVVFLIESYTETNHLYLSLYIYFQYLSRVDRRRPCRQCKLNQRLDATNFMRQKPQAKIVFRCYVSMCMCLCLCLCERVFFSFTILLLFVNNAIFI